VAPSRPDLLAALRLGGCDRVHVIPMVARRGLASEGALLGSQVGGADLALDFRVAHHIGLVP
jgi:hypothetical protein